MSSIDSHDNERHNKKVFHDKKQQNDERFNEIRHYEQKAVMEAHFKLMHIVEKLIEQAQDEHKKELAIAKEESDFISNLNYNESINKSLVVEKFTDRDELDRIAAFLKSIENQIKAIESYIHELKREKFEIANSHKKSKSDLADEMIKFINDDNPSISIRIQPFMTELYNLLRPKSDNEDISKMLYLQFVKLYAQRLKEDDSRISNMLDECQKLAHNLVSDYAKSKSTHISPQLNREITTLANQFVMQMQRDMSKNPAISDKVKEVCYYEREEAKLDIKIASAEIKQAQLGSIYKNVKENIDQFDIMSRSDANRILSNANAQYSELENISDIFASATINLEKTDAFIKTIEKIDPTDSPEEKINQIKQITEQHLASLNDGLDILSVDVQSKLTIPTK